MKIMFVSLGCDKNLVDTENMLGLLHEKGFEFTEDEMQADVIAINSCCFIHDAKQESINTILEMAEHKKDGVCKALIVTGCLAHRYKDEIMKEIPEVDAIIGTSSYDKISEVVLSVLEGKGYNCIDDADRLPKVESDRIITTGGYYEYLKIAEGCDKHCTYCIIPSVRGNFRSYPIEYLIKQAKYLVDHGAKELILVAQETTMYGTDLYGEKSLPKLLHELAQIEGLYWIRILYCYPEEITDELIQAIKNEPKVCNYLDMPIQHASNRILKRMGRRTSQEELKEVIGKLRKEIPDIALRTTLITGFPGETKDDMEELLDFVDEMEFDRLGVFTYSPEEGTPAAAMENQIDEQCKQERRDEVMALQQEISSEKSQDMIGKTIEVMIEGYLEEDETYVGRSYKDAPNVDGYVFVNTNQKLMSGDFVKVKITTATEYDLIGELLNET
jgi:ribosomal protein S12 methylthiotransferase